MYRLCAEHVTAFSPVYKAVASLGCRGNGNFFALLVSAVAALGNATPSGIVGSKAYRIIPLGVFYRDIIGKSRRGAIEFMVTKKIIQYMIPDACVFYAQRIGLGFLKLECKVVFRISIGRYFKSIKTLSQQPFRR